MIYKEHHSRCNLCPRNCNADRENTAGFCGEKNIIRIAKVSLHQWEEPCISYKNGSGTVFFSGCNLKCVYCQNAVIANNTVGFEVSRERLTDIFLEQQERGADNINLVTPSHYISQVADCLEQAKNKGLNIPVVYNTSAYEKVEMLRTLSGLVDIYLPDLKYVDSELSAKYSNAPDYFEVAAGAIEEMKRQCPKDIFENGKMVKGVIIRHLLLPGKISDSKAVLLYLRKKYGREVYVSIMNQYTPMKELAETYPELARKVTQREYDRLVDYALGLELLNAFIQEEGTAEESFIPDFNGENI